MHLTFGQFSEVGSPDFSLPLWVVRRPPVSRPLVAQVDGQRPVILLGRASQLRQTQEQRLIQRVPCYWLAYSEQG